MKSAGARRPALARRLAGLSMPARLSLAFLLGALAASGFAPLFLLPLYVAGFAGLYLLLEEPAPRRRWAIAFFFAWGHFVAGHYWIGISFFVDAGRFGWLVPLPVLGLPAGLALMPMLGVALATAVPATGVARLMLIAAGWSFADYLRSVLLTGFPWNLPGYVWAFSAPSMQPLALIGSHATSLLTLALAMSPGLFLTGDGPPAGRRRFALAGIGLVATAAAFGLWRTSGAPRADVPNLGLRLVQASVPQSLKWVESERARHLRKHFELSTGPGVERVNVWVWPESAIAYFVEQEPDLLAALRGLAGADRLLLSGTVRRTSAPEPLAIFNSLVAIDGQGISARYDKQHLVPFGEYLPLRGLLGLVGLDKLAHGAVDFSAGGGDGLIRVPGLPPARALICYEAIFPDEIRRDPLAPIGWLLNITNDGWFGVSSGPFQHLAAARARAVEQGLPLVRAANNGVSAIIDPLGRIVASLGLNQVGVVDGPLPRPLDGGTLYRRIGDTAYFALLAIFVIGAILSARLARRP